MVKLLEKFRSPILFNRSRGCRRAWYPILGPRSRCEEDEKKGEEGEENKRGRKANQTQSGGQNQTESEAGLTQVREREYEYAKEQELVQVGGNPSTKVIQISFHQIAGPLR